MEPRRCTCGVVFRPYHSGHVYHSPKCRPRDKRAGQGTRHAAGEAAEPYWRPTTRGDCANVPRPCVFVGCSKNNYLDVNAATGSIKFNFPHLEPHQMEKSCSLDEAERDGMTLEAVGMTLNITRERTRQIETMAIEKVRKATEEMERAS